ncbi:MAG: hypothetical protein KJ706_06850 [Candidatus Omnitrophica bacterium]|nr:hypothetical protein [Candidatus Omnitrophota bacterium]
MLNNIYQHTQEIRDLINNTRKQHALLKNLKFWNQMCSSLDVIGDADLTIDSYLNNDFPNCEGSKYLQVYGVLQALFIQQDAVAHLCESLSISFYLSSHYFKVGLSVDDMLRKGENRIQKYSNRRNN